MNYDTFVDQVAQRTRTSSERAVELTRATLETLAERLTGGEVLDLAAQLPQAAATGAEAEPGHRGGGPVRRGGVRRPGRRSGPASTRTPPADAVRAVFTTLREAISGGEFDDIVVQLPRDYRDMVEPALAPGATLRRG